MARRVRAVVEGLRGGRRLALALLPALSPEVFIGHNVNVYLLAGAILAGLLFIFIMAYAIYEMFKH